MKSLQPFKETLQALVEHKPTATDTEIAIAAKTSVRTVQRRIAALRQLGVVKIHNNRYLHAAYGWCNERTMFF